MGLIPEERKQYLKEELEKNLKDNVRIFVFTARAQVMLAQRSSSMYI